MYKVKSNYEIKDIDEKAGRIQAYVSIFGNVDSDNDITMPGAFSKTVKEWGPSAPNPRIKHLWQHNRYEVIGVPSELYEDQKGLFVDSKMGTDQFSKDKLQQHIDGLITEFSYGYEVIKSRPSKSDEKVQELLELKLWEYSSVTWGSNMLTHVIGAKGDNINYLDELNTRMDKLIKALRNGNYTDDTFIGFELELKQIQTIYNELVKGNEPPEGTHHEPDEPTLSNEEAVKLLKEFNLKFK